MRSLLLTLLSACTFTCCTPSARLSTAVATPVVEDKMPATEQVLTLILEIKKAGPNDYAFGIKNVIRAKGTLKPSQQMVSDAAFKIIFTSDSNIPLDSCTCINPTVRPMEVPKADGTLELIRTSQEKGIVSARCNNKPGISRIRILTIDNVFITTLTIPKP